MAAAAKPSLASVAASMGGEPDADDVDDTGYDANSDFQTAVAELADVLGVSEDKMGAFSDALEAVIRTCM